MLVVMIHVYHIKQLFGGPLLHNHCHVAQWCSRHYVDTFLVYRQPQNRSYDTQPYRVVLVIIMFCFKRDLIHVESW